MKSEFLPVEQWYEIGMGILGYTAQQVRDMTVEEMSLAIDGYMKSNGTYQSSKKMISRNEFLDIIGK